MENIEKILKFVNSSGDCDGSGSGSGYGSGYGYGDGYGDGVCMFNSLAVHQIDGVATIITNVKRNIAKGYILNDDLTLTPCYIAKGHNKFAHGETLHKALEDLQSKIFEDMDPEKAIDLFLQEFDDLGKKYPAKAYYVWHNRLTGSCEMGRNLFVTNGGYDLENDTFTVQEFIDITKNEYGGDIIKELEKKVNKKYRGG